MTRGTCREARTQGVSICRHIGATEDAASRRVTPVRRPGSLCGQAPSAPDGALAAYEALNRATIGPRAVSPQRTGEAERTPDPQATPPRPPPRSLAPRDVRV